MQVSCPHCSQPFEPERAGVQFCPRCGGQLDVPASSVSPPAARPPTASPVPPATPAAAPWAAPWTPSGAGMGGGGSGGTGAAGPPPGGNGDLPDVAWERRSALGFTQALAETIKPSLLSPQTFWATVRPDGPMIEAFWYAWLIYALGTVFRLPVLWLGRNSVNGIVEQLQRTGGMTPQMRDILTSYMQLGGGAQIPAALAGVLLFPIGLVIAAGVLHLCALITGAGGQGFKATFRVICYSFTPFLFGIHECLGFLGFLYQLVLFAIGLRVVQRTTLGKAVGATLMPLLFACVCCCVGSVVAGVFAAQASR